MRKIPILLYILTISFCGLCQQGDSLQAGIALKLIGLNFSAPELDSMQDELKQSLRNFTQMRRLPVPNELSYPFAFHPAPPGFKVPTRQENVVFRIPDNVNLPADKNELAFYSLPQLASLIKHKKISSEALTNFFLDRLRKWGIHLNVLLH